MDSFDMFLGEVWQLIIPNLETGTATSVCIPKGKRIILNIQSL